MVQPAKIVVLGLLGLTGILSIVAIATHYWYEVSFLGASINGGLWQICSSSALSSGSTCGSITTSNNAKLNSARGLTILALILNTASGALIITSMRPERNRLAFVATGILTLQAVLQAAGVGMAAWMVKTDLSTVLTLGFAWSFYMACVVIGLYIVSLIITSVSAGMEGGGSPYGHGIN